MTFITEGKTNWNFIGIVAVLAIIVGVGIWFFSTLIPEAEEPAMLGEVEKDEVTEEDKAISEEEKFSVLYPNGGEEWIVENTYEIKWTPLENIETVRITLCNKDVRAYEEEITSEYPNTGTFTWRIPSILRPQISGYVIRIEECFYNPETNFTVCGTGVIAQSDAVFSIIEKTSKPSITILSPNGGEEWMVGNTYDIKWELAPGSKGVGIQIAYISEGEDLNRMGTIIAHTIGTSYRWLIPSNFSPGKYRIQIRMVNGGSSELIPSVNYDYSDNYFSIIAPVVEEFDFQYAFGPVFFQHVLDTRTNTYKHVSCPDFPEKKVEEYEFKITETEKQKIYDAIIKNDLFNLEKTEFVEYCEPDGPCIIVDPINRTELSIIVNGKDVTDIAWETYLIPDDPEYIKSLNVKTIIDRIISDKLEQMGIEKVFCLYF